MIILSTENNREEQNQSNKGCGQWLVSILVRKWLTERTNDMVLYSATSTYC